MRINQALGIEEWCYFMENTVLKVCSAVKWVSGESQIYLWNSEIFLFAFNESILNDWFQQRKLYINLQFFFFLAEKFCSLIAMSPLSVYIFQQDQYYHSSCFPITLL